MQDQVQPVEHRHPPRPRPGGVGALAEPDVQFPERAAAEVHIGAVQQRRLVRAQAGVIQRPEQRIVAGGGRVLAGGGDPGLEEVEELAHPLRGRRRQQSRRVVADMARGVELVDRADQPDPERGLDLHGLAGLQEPVEALEDLHIVTAGGRLHGPPPPGRRPRGRCPQESLPKPAGPGRCSVRSSRPVSFSIVTGLNPRARHEATNASTHTAWNSHGSRAAARPGLLRPRSPADATPPPGTPSSHLMN